MVGIISEKECLHAARLIRRRKHKKVKVVSDVCASFSIICAVPRKELLSALTVSRHHFDHLMLLNTYCMLIELILTSGVSALLFQNSKMTGILNEIYKFYGIAISLLLFIN